MTSKTDAIRASIPELFDLCNDTLDAGLVPFIGGDPAIGKSAIARKIADSRNLELIDIRLLTLDTTDLTGFPFQWEEDGQRKAGFLPMDLFPLEDWELPEGKNGWLILWDEITSASKMLEAAAYKVILDRLIGRHSLHPACEQMAAGNLVTSGAVASRSGTAMQSRLVNFEAYACYEGWAEHAIEADFDERVRAYINWKPGALHQFSTEQAAKQANFTSPRTWEFMSRLCKVWGPEIPGSKLAAINGCIGPEARAFLSFCQLYKSLPTYETILERPRQVTFNKEPGVEYAVVEMITGRFKRADLNPIMEFIPALSVDLQAILLRGILKKDISIKQEPVIKEWIRLHGKKLQRKRT
jgi:hypothetical protein